MSDTKNEAPQKLAVRDFRDAGTKRRFKQGEPVDATPGELANYEAAGLVADPDSLPGEIAQAEASAESDPPATAPKRTR